MQQGFKDLIVYQKAYQLATEIFERTEQFPKEERYSLVDQIRRCSRSICASLAEAWRKRMYEKHFISKLTDADAECSETLVWIDFSFDCGYIEEQTRAIWKRGYEEIGKMLYSMETQPKKFCRKQ